MGANRTEQSVTPGSSEVERSFCSSCASRGCDIPCSAHRRGGRGGCGASHGRAGRDARGTSPPTCAARCAANEEAVKVPQKLQAWIVARKRHRLSHAHVQMARELGMNPKSLGKLDNHDQEPWKRAGLGDWTTLRSDEDGDRAKQRADDRVPRHDCRWRWSTGLWRWQQHARGACADRYPTERRGHRVTGQRRNVREPGRSAQPAVLPLAPEPWRQGSAAPVFLDGVQPRATTGVPS